MTRFKSRWRIAAIVLGLCPALLAQGNSDGARLRDLNAEVLRLRGLLNAVEVTSQVQGQTLAPSVFAQRQALLESLMASDPGAALSLAFPASVLSDLATAFPQAAGLIETRGAWQGPLYYHIEDGVGLSSHKEVRKLKVGNQLFELHSASPVVAGSKCNQVISASGVRSNNKIVAESTTLVAAGATCSPIGAQKIAVILASFPSSPIPAGITPDFVRGVFLGNSFTSNQSTPDLSISDFWTQNSDGKTWVNSSGTGLVTVVPVNLNQDYAYCTSSNGAYSDNSAAARQAAYAAADGILNYNDFSRVVVVLPNNGTCNGIAGVGTIGCWSSECPGDGACNYSWTWWRADQISSRTWGVELGTHEMGHNLGMGHSGSRYFSGAIIGPVGVAGTRVEYGDLFGTMGQWNTGFYNAQHALNQIGWLTSQNVLTVTQSGAYSIQSYDTRPAGLKALRVQRGTGNTSAWLYVSFYPHVGNYLSGLPTQVNGGAILHYQDSATQAGKTDLLDFTQATPNNFSDPALLAGQTWKDPYTDLTISVTGIVNNMLNVTVNYGTTACTSAAPTVTISPTIASVVAGTAASFTISAHNNDSASCAARSFSVSSSLPSGGGWSSSLSPSSMTLAPGATGTSTLTKTPAASIVPGTYTVSATAGGVATNPNASLTVTAPPVPPAAPSGVSITASYTGGGANKTLTQVKVTWSDKSNNETQFSLERCKVSGSGATAVCNFAPLAIVPANTSAYIDPAASLSGTGTYKYRVRSENASGVSAWVQQQKAI